MSKHQTIKHQARQKSLHTVVFTNDLLNTNKQTNTFIKEKVFVAL